MNRIIDYGKHAVDGKARRNLITLTVSVEPTKYYDPTSKNNYMKGEHFSVCGDVWNSTHTDIIHGGQCVDYIVENFAKDKTSQNIRALWEVFHLQQMDLIPERFRTEINGFVSGAVDSIEIERKSCAAYLLQITEKVTDYGTYTDGTITIKTPDNIEEVITICQGDETKHPISQRAHDIINWLYENAPSTEDLALTANVTTNAEEYRRKKEQDRANGLAEIRAIAARIIGTIDAGNAGEKWSVAKMEIKYAEEFLKEVTQ